MDTAADLRERLKLKYVGDCKCGHCALVPDELVARASDEIERLRAENQQAWNECDAQDVARTHAVAEIDRLRAQRDQLLAALNLTMLGGNHLANVLIGRLGGGFATQYPPDLDHEVALRMLGATDTYAVWCCWAAIMSARAAVEGKP